MRRFAPTAVLVIALLSLAPAAHGAPPGETTFGIVEFFDGSPGVFTSDGSVVCASGTTSNDTFATGFPSDRGGLFHVRKTITCNDGSGTFVLQIQAQTGLRADGTLGPWVVLSGTGAYVDLRGTGKVVGTFFPGGISDVYTGWLSNGPRAATWDPVQDWLRAPGESNPSPDGFGNPAVWSYRGSAGFEHDPKTYALLPRYSVIDLNREEWTDPGFLNLLVGRIEFDRAILMHSWGGREFGFGRNAVLAWTSPVAGRVAVRGEVRLVHATCTLGSGIIWSVDQGSEPLQTTIVPAHGSATFDLTTTVRKGESLYFIHDPGLDSHCDSAFVTLSISKP